MGVVDEVGSKAAPLPRQAGVLHLAPCGGFVPPWLPVGTPPLYHHLDLIIRSPLRAHAQQVGEGWPWGSQPQGPASSQCGPGWLHQLCREQEPGGGWGTGVGVLEKGVRPKKGARTPDPGPGMGLYLLLFSAGFGLDCSSET